MENVSFWICSFLSDEWISTKIGMSLPVNCQFDTGTAVKESRRLLMTSRDQEELLATLGVEEELRHNYFLILSSSVLVAGGEEL